MQKPKFLSLEQLKQAHYGTRELLERELKKAGFAVETATYRPVQLDSGGWGIETIDPDASQELEPPGPSPVKSKPKASKASAPQKPVTPNRFGPGHPPIDKPVTPDGKPIDVVYQDDAGVAVVGEVEGKVVVHPATARMARQPVATPLAKPDAKKKTPPPPRPKSTGGKSSDPSPEDLPKGFEAWALAEAHSKGGVLRTDLNKKIGTERRWSNYLIELGKKHDLKFSSVREGRFTRFFLK
jgi:hypothetical protein